MLGTCSARTERQATAERRTPQPLLLLLLVLLGLRLQELLSLLEHVAEKNRRARHVRGHGHHKEKRIVHAEIVGLWESLVDHVELGGDSQRIHDEEEVVSEPLQLGWHAAGQVEGVVVVSDYLGDAPGHMDSQVGWRVVALGERKHDPDADDDQQSRGHLHDSGHERGSDDADGRMDDLQNSQALDGRGPLVRELKHMLRVHGVREKHVDQREAPQRPRQRVVSKKVLVHLEQELAVWVEN